MIKKRDFFFLHLIVLCNALFLFLCKSASMIASSLTATILRLLGLVPFLQPSKSLTNTIGGNGKNKKNAGQFKWKETIEGKAFALNQWIFF